MQKISVFWFRRDLRLEDNRGLQEALCGPFPVLPIFVFDENILAELDAEDPRITFIHDTPFRLSDSIKQRSGTGCDAAPYFRIFNPTEQLRKYDPQKLYVRKWIPELGSPGYPAPMVDHKVAVRHTLDSFARYSVKYEFHTPRGRIL
ncbi:MAG: FAD-binding domain-containing protein [Bacteroidales bacterium]|jgi:deoxyribodipyrimidine photolyase|nr:deoxyribodipyrimidine photo-lyase [Bacteroidales bacterium]MDD2264871.1 FAD-binding domain-containing protein [Bacteroidales bacterium]MDD2831948.1 FAD-binding domain-containing protein [Bacteroidales bacterium]MDD4473558.1 FAD-binding domain-containing protein [Bacteroidales bacterium]MDD5047225.1 FAD-binding domain-containing protein [Bacteroidales bacterium]